MAPSHAKAVPATGASNGNTSPSSAHTVTALSRWSVDDNDSPLPPVSRIKAIHVYDFDNTLFASCLPNDQLWQQSAIGKLKTEDLFSGGGWWHDVNILAATGEGVEAEEAKAWAGWWNETIASLCQLSMEQNDALSVLLTGRGESRFAGLLKRMIKSKGLRFDMVCLKPKTGPSNQTFSSTMKYKQELLRDVMFTYTKAEELRIYEDRANHVKQFRDFFSSFNKELMGPKPASSRQTISADVIEVATKARTLDPIVEISEVQKMINAHNLAFQAGTAPRNASPYKIEKHILNTGYIVSAKDFDKLVDLVPPAIRTGRNNVTVQCSNIAITAGVAPKPVVDSLGGAGKMVRWKVTGVGVVENKIWAARVEPVPPTEKILTMNRPSSIILAMARNAHVKDVNQIKDHQWAPVTGAQATTFETLIGEKCLLSLEKESGPKVVPEAKGTKRHADQIEIVQPEFIGLDSSSAGMPSAQNRRKRNDDRPVVISNNNNNNSNYRGGNQSRGRGQKDRGGRGGRGSAFARNDRGGNSRGGRGGGRGGNDNHRGGNSHQGGRDNYGGNRNGYTDHDASGANNASGGLYNAY